MRKAPVIPAAILAVGFALLLPTAAGARVTRAGTAERKPHSRPTATHRKKPVAAQPSWRARSVIHQSAAGEAVLDPTETAEAHEPGAFVPPAYYNYPPSPNCEPVDVMVEARLHEAGSDGETESQTAEVAQEATGSSTATSRLKRIARGFGSLFRPKSSAASVRPDDVDLSDLLSREFLIPVQGVDAERLRDSFLASRGRYAKHLAIDIGAPRGTPVLATTDGEIVRISRERRGGKSIYQKDSTGHYLLFYCHLSRYAERIGPGEKVRKGDLIGYVGSTGHVVGGPHLHFSITRLPDDEADLKKGLAINPYLLFLGAP